MAEQEGVSIVDAVSEGRYQAMFALRNMFGVTELKDIGDQWVPVIAALQGMPQQLVDEVGIPVVARFFEDENLDPKDAGDREQAAPFASLIASTVGTAAQFVYENMQRQAMQAEQSRQKILAPGGVLR
ncbi:hypothetical protein MAL1_00161 [Bacteriophage DSS3_MAL1]|nr:hypothetical protein MAL1_00161 [Bacteriophage DSS3_MAL1]